MGQDTPRTFRARSRGFGTLIGNGWLRESPRNLVPRGWDIRGRSALRKCLFLPAPEGLKEAGPPISPAAMPPPRPRVDTPIHVKRRDPRRDVREMAAVDPEAVRRAAYERYARAAIEGQAPRSWWEDPVALGTLLILAPPVGLAALWSSRRYSTDARWALTVMTALMLCLVSAVVIAALASR